MLVFGISGFAQKAIQKSLINPSVKERYTVKAHMPMVPYQRAVGDSIWGNDFSNASDWTMYHTGGSGDWEIHNTQDANAGYGTGTITNSTWQNGFAIYDADLYGDDSNGEDAYIEYTGTIDCSTYGNVALVCQQYGRKWQTTKMYVEVSTDGVTWDSIEVNTDWVTSVTSDNPLNVNISAFAANQATVHIRFHYHGGWDYCWNIDDVKLIEGADYDLVGQNWIPNFYGAGWYSKMPKENHTALTYFQVPVFNNGTQTATGLSLTVTIDDETATQVYNQTTTTTLSGNTDLAGGGLDTLYNDQAFDPDTTATHTYTVNMSIDMTGGQDQDTTNNYLHPAYTFDITNLQIERATTINRWLSTASYSGSVSGDVLGTVFYLPNPDTVSSADVYMFADANALTNGASIQATLYSVDQATGDWVEVISSDPYDITAADTVSTGHWVNLPFQTDGFSEILSQGGWYMVGIKMFMDPSTDYVGLGSDNVFPHDYQNSVALSVNGTWYYSSAGVPDIILNFMPTVSNNMQSAQAEVSIYPNPANTEIHIDNAEGATISVYNLMGQNVMTVENANKFNTVNVEALAAGTYVVKVVNNNEVKTQKINIVK